MKTPAWVKVDSAWLSALVNNLLANAIWVFGGALLFATITWIEKLPYSIVALATFCGAVGSLHLGGWIKNWLALPKRSPFSRRSEAANQEQILTGRPWASEEHLRESHIHDCTFFINDIPRDQSANRDITDKTFERCTILGPAVIIFDQSIPVESLFKNENLPEGTLWPKNNGPAFIGAIFIRGCIIKGCTFRWIGLAGDDACIAILRRDLRIPPPAGGSGN